VKRLSPLLVALGLVAASACGGGGDDDSSSGRGSAGGSASEAASGAFPVTIEHRYGETTVASEPERVVSVGFTDQDPLLALGIVPVGIRDWYGDQPNAVWPWAQDLLAGEEPEVLSAEEINAEAIAALDPDLIVGVSSGMTEEEYDTLSQIAPTLAQSGDYVDYGMPWQEGTRMIGEAVGRPDEAEAMIADVEGQQAAARSANPEFEGAEATVSYVMDETNIGAYSPEDARSRLLTDLGMVIPEEIADLAGDQFYSQFSKERIGLLDRDLIVWIAGESGVEDRIRQDPLHGQLRAAAEGREVFLTQMEGGAASFSSVISLPYLLETLVPRMAAAIDGDPATPVPAG
jgi:iron complex transport system substrate-binding protein